jgi:hypothetical protein
LLKLKDYKIEISQTLPQNGKARVLDYVKNNANKPGPCGSVGLAYEVKY